MKQYFYACLFFFFGIGTIMAQDEVTIEPISTDRPDATEAPTTVPKGALQIETGAFYTSFEDTFEGNTVKEETLGYNTTLVRWGLLDNFELRLGWNFEEGQTTVNGTKLMDVSSGFSPLLTGIKINIAEEDGWIPTLGFLAHLYLPLSASSDYRPETTGADFRVSFSYTVSENSGIGANLGAAWGNDSPEVAYIYTLSYGYTVATNLTLYAEIYGDLPEDSASNHFWDAGLTYLVNSNFQLDATVGRSFTEGQDLLLSAGLSYRIPKKKI